MKAEAVHMKTDLRALLYVQTQRNMKSVVEVSNEEKIQNSRWNYEEIEVRKQQSGEVEGSSSKMKKRGV